MHGVHCQGRTLEHPSCWSHARRGWDICCSNSCPQARTWLKHPGGLGTNSSAAGFRLDLTLGSGVGPHIGMPDFSDEKCTLSGPISEEELLTLACGPRSATRSSDLQTLAAGKPSSFFSSRPSPKMGLLPTWAGRSLADPFRGGRPKDLDREWAST